MKGMDKYGIYEYKPGKWQVYFSHEGKQIHLQQMEDGRPLTSKSMAFVLITHLKRNGYQPEKFGKDSSFHFDQAIKVWIKSCNISPEWKQQRLQMADRFFIPFFKKRDIREIKTIHIQEFFANLKSKHYSSKYEDTVISELKTFFRFYRKSLKELPDFPKIEVQEPAIRWLTAEEQDKIFKHIPQQDLPIFTFMRFYGCRTNEASGLLKENLFLKHNPPYVVLSTVLGANGELKPYTKTKRLKILPIISEIDWIFSSDNPSEFVFAKKWRGEWRPYSNRMLNLIWNRANALSKVQKINLYNGMRHSFACQRLNDGYSMDEVKAVLGHTDVRTTERYAKYIPTKLEDVIRGKKPIYKLFIPQHKVQLIEYKDGKRLGGKDSNLG